MTVPLAGWPSLLKCPAKVHWPWFGLLLVARGFRRVAKLSPTMADGSVNLPAHLTKLD